MPKKSEPGFKKGKKEPKVREEYSKELNQVIHNNKQQEVTKHKGT